jgi:hypothetical protein
MTQEQPAVQCAERISDLIAEDLEKVPCWVGAGVLPKRGTLLFGGLEKIGKSFVGLELARALSTATPLFGYPEFVTEKARVLMVEAEIGKFGLKERVTSVFQKESVASYGDHFWYVSQEPALRLDTQEGIENFVRIMDLVQPNVLLLDPISNMHSKDENSNSEVGDLFAAIDWLKAHYKHNDMSVVLSHHMGKKATYKDSKIEADPLSHHNFRGALRWTAAPDSICTMHRKREIAPHAWELQTRWLTRHSAPPPEMSLLVNRNDDLRVKFEHEKGMIAPLVKPGPKPLGELVKTKLVKAEQTNLGFEGV